MEKVRLTVAVFTVILTFVLILQNQEPVATNLLLWSVELPRFVLLGAVFFIGGFAGYLVGRKTRIGGKSGAAEDGAA